MTTEFYGVKKTTKMTKIGRLRTLTSSEFNDLCRLCLMNTRIKLNIFHDEGIQRQVHQKILNCLSLIVSFGISQFSSSRRENISFKKYLTLSVLKMNIERKCWGCSTKNLSWSKLVTSTQCNTSCYWQSSVMLLPFTQN